MERPRAVIFGCSGVELSAVEKDFFRQISPLGFILFARNCRDPEQVRMLTGDLRDSVARHDAPILVDQEGGRVQRLGPPHWRVYPAASTFGRIAEEDMERAKSAVRLNARLIATELSAIGVNVDCLPVLDVPAEGAHDIIGDRAFSSNPLIVSELGRSTCEGLFAGGVMPVIKHIPGHGRARVDSHHSLPRVDAGEATLAESDFVPFQALHDMPWAMTAHVLYERLDPSNAATLSESVVGNVIRGRIGFHGLLLTDDISMGALEGPVADRARRSLSAGCDVVLHCNGEMAEMRAIADICPSMNDASWQRYERGSSQPNVAEEFDAEAALAELTTILG